MMPRNREKVESAPPKFAFYGLTNKVTNSNVGNENICCENNTMPSAQLPYATASDVDPDPHYRGPHGSGSTVIFNSTGKLTSVNNTFQVLKSK